ncbi:hypothetical protein OG900_37995 [Streptomyces sp. NBC_00433]
MGSAGELGRKYTFTEKTSVGGKVYGIANFANVQGFVCNRQARLPPAPTPVVFLLLQRFVYNGFTRGATK